MQQSTSCIWANLKSGELERAVVYGVYTAVQYADTVMLHRLAGLSSILTTDAHLQVVCTLPFGLPFFLRTRFYTFLFTSEKVQQRKSP